MARPTEKLEDRYYELLRRQILAPHGLLEKLTPTEERHFLFLREEHLRQFRGSFKKSCYISTLLDKLGIPH